MKKTAALFFTVVLMIVVLLCPALSEEVRDSSGMAGCKGRMWRLHAASEDSGSAEPGSGHRCG